MKTSRTPGPWHIDIGQIDKSFLVGRLQEAVFAKDGTPIAICGENQDNARLIAAAPELLAALEGVLCVADRKTDEFDAARAAIAKARGNT